LFFNTGVEDVSGLWEKVLLTSFSKSSGLKRGFVCENNVEIYLQRQRNRSREFGGIQRIPFRYI